jgi:hypothetical protein
MIDAVEVVDSFLVVAGLAHLTLSASEVRVEVLRAPHQRPTRLPAGTQAVYIFLLGESCLKVGKAGPKTAARFVSQHYGFSAPSTLARSMLAHSERTAACLPPARFGEVDALCEDSIGEWIATNTDRVNVYLPTSKRPFALSLLEAFIHCRLKPVFEGETA